VPHDIALRLVHLILAVTRRHPTAYGNFGSGISVGVQMDTTSPFAAVGTIAVLFIATQGSGQSIGDHAEWTRIYSATGAGTRTHTQAAFLHVITQADIDAPSDWVNYGFPLGVSGPWEWWIMSYDGVDPVNPVDAHASNASSVDGSSVTAPSVTTTRAGCRIVEGFGGTAPIGFPPKRPTLSTVTGWITGWGNSSSDWPALGVADQEQVSAGATGTLTSTLHTGSGSSPPAGTPISGSWVAGTIALRPPSGGWGVGMVRMGGN
jgi:hypothetical protein